MGIMQRRKREARERSGLARRKVTTFRVCMRRFAVCFAAVEKSLRQSGIRKRLHRFAKEPETLTIQVPFPHSPMPVETLEAIFGGIRGVSVKEVG